MKWDSNLSFFQNITSMSKSPGNIKESKFGQFLNHYPRFIPTLLDIAEVDCPT